MSEYIFLFLGLYLSFILVVLVQMRDELKEVKKRLNKLTGSEF